MRKERELLRAALDFLYPRRWVEPEQQQVLDVLTRDIEELLAQPEHIPDVGNMVEQEPVAWIDPENYKQVIAKPYGALRYITRTPNEGDIPLYTSPPTREPLSDEDIRVIINQLPTGVDLDTGIELCRIIDKHWSR